MVDDVQVMPWIDLLIQRRPTARMLNDLYVMRDNVERPDYAGPWTEDQAHKTYKWACRRARFSSRWLHYVAVEFDLIEALRR